MKEDVTKEDVFEKKPFNVKKIKVRTYADSSNLSQEEFCRPLLLSVETSSKVETRTQETSASSGSAVPPSP